MDDLAQTLGWIAPLLFGLIGWLAVKLRDTEWGRDFTQHIGLSRREHEQDWEFQRRLGSFWLTVSAIVGAVAYVAGQRLLQDDPDTPAWVGAVAILGIAICVWAAFKSIRAFRASRRGS